MVQYRYRSKTLPLVRVINDMDKFVKIGYLVINVKEKSLFEIYNNTTLKNNTELYIINNDGCIVSHENKAKLGQKQNSGYLDKILNGSSRYEFFITEIEKKNYYISFHPISGTTFKIVSIVPAIESD